MTRREPRIVPTPSESTAHRELTDAGYRPLMRCECGGTVYAVESLGRLFSVCATCSPTVRVKLPRLTEHRTERTGGEPNGVVGRKARGSAPVRPGRTGTRTPDATRTVAGRPHGRSATRSARQPKG